MTYFTEVAQGVISQSEGKMIIYLQRSASVDDDKGVNEVLKVYDPFLTESWILLFENEAQWEEDFRYVQDLMNNKEMVFYSKDKIDEGKGFQDKYEDLKLNVDFVDKKRFVLRL